MKLFSWKAFHSIGDDERKWLVKIFVQGALLIAKQTYHGPSSNWQMYINVLPMVCDAVL